jgi:hypothetical protein
MREEREERGWFMLGFPIFFSKSNTLRTVSSNYDPFSL